MATRALKIKEQVLEDLRDPIYAARYLSEALQEGDEVVLKTALADVVRAHGVSQVARRARINRTTAYKTLREGTESTFTTVSALLDACGFRFCVEPIEGRKRA
jgi:probable addiction module antidote protein